MHALRKADPWTLRWHALRRLEHAEQHLAHRSRELPSSAVDLAHEVGIEPDPWQREFLLSDAQGVLLCTSRQVGKTTASAVLALHTVLSTPGSLVLCVAPALRQSQELLVAALQFYRALGRPIAPVAEGRLHLELENGSRLMGLPGTEKTIRGFGGVDLVILDEAARIDDQLYFALRPMLATSGGRMVLLSTPFGKRGVFYQAWIGDEDWERHEITADKCPRIPPEFLEHERRVLPTPILEQEYLCQYIDLTWQLFPSESIDRCTDDNVVPITIPRRAAA